MTYEIMVTYSGLVTIDASSREEAIKKVSNMRDDELENEANGIWEIGKCLQ